MSVSVACGAEGTGEGNRTSALEAAATLELWPRGECDFGECRWDLESTLLWQVDLC